MSDDTSAVRRVFDCAELLALCCEWLPLASVLAARRVSRDWQAVLGHDEAPVDQIAPNAQQTDLLLSRYAMPDARMSSRANFSGALAPIAAEPARAIPAAVLSADPPSADGLVDGEDHDDSSSSISLSYLHLRTTLDLASSPPFLSQRQALVRAFHHPEAKLRRIVLRGSAENLANAATICQLHPRTLGVLDELSTCACLVGPYVSEDAEDGLFSTLKRWSETPLDNSSEHAQQHLFGEAALRLLLPQMTSLRVLNLAHQRLWDPSLQLIGEHLHRTLEVLNLNFNVDITNLGLNFLDRCFLLQELQLQRCWKLTTAGIAPFFHAIATGYTQLQKGADDSQDNSPGGDSPSAPPTCALRLINLNECRERGASLLLALLGHTPNLAHVELAELNLEADVLQQLARACPKIEYANLSRVGSTSNLGINSFAPSPEMRLTDVGLSYLSSLVMLKRLDIERAQITNYGLKFLAQRHLPHLEHLSLWQCEEIGDVGIMHLLGMDQKKGHTASVHPTLAFLLLPHNLRLITGAATELVTTLCPSMRHLMGYVPFATIKPLDALLATHRRSLRSLSLSVDGNGGGGGQPKRAFCDRTVAAARVDTSSLRQLALFTELECLDILCPALRDGDLLHVLRALPFLRVLKLTRCNLTDDAFQWSKMAITPPPQPTPMTEDEASASPVAFSPSPFTPSSRIVPLYFDPSSVGWACRLELIYLSQLAYLTSRGLEAIGRLSTVRYLDVSRCDGLKEDEAKAEAVQREWREQIAAGLRLPITCAVRD